MLNLKNLSEEYKRFHNDVCLLHDYELVRLLGVAEDDFDLYYKVVNLAGKVYYASAVGACESLREVYSRYTQLDSVFEHNNAKKTEVFSVETLHTTEISPF